MSKLAVSPPAPAGTGVQAGLLVAAAKIPETFTPGLSARSVVDQGLITGLSAGLQYLLALGAQDALEAVAAELAKTTPAGRWSPDPAARHRLMTLAADLAVIPFGLAVQRALPTRPGEAMARGALRQAGWRLATTGLGGALLILATSAGRRVDARLGADGRIASFPVAIPVGLSVAYLLDRRRANRVEVTELETPTPPSALRSLAVSAGVVGAMAGTGYGEHLLAGLLGRRLGTVLPGGPHLWRLVGHGAFLALFAFGASSLWQHAMRKIEAGTSADEPVLGPDEGTRWTGPTLSGGPGSHVPWSTLGQQGRRHMLAHVRPAPVARPPGIPDLSIETVMREPARRTPVQVYVGLDSASTPRERVDLALAEMDRTGAFDRSLLMLVSPTGTGYVNYAAVAATQYLTRGDMASVTLQYSRRPSPLSLGMIKGAREQNRLLWLRILERLHRQSGPRPRVVLFGESLGAHTSQDVFLHWGTLGLQALGIDRALWIGTPYGSKWMHEVTGPDRLDVDHEAIAVVNDFAQLESLKADRPSAPRYVLLSHDNDGVTKFGPDLLTTAPGWLRPDRPKVEQVDGASPRGISPNMRWRPITTFFQTLVDMKNAQLPGVYRAWAHDYRPDLPRFVSEVFDLPASAQQVADIESAVERRETLRKQLFDAPVSSASRR